MVENNAIISKIPNFVVQMNRWYSDIKKKYMASKTYVSKTINWIRLKSCVLMSSFNTGAVAQIIGSHAK